MIDHQQFSEEKFLKMNLSVIQEQIEDMMDKLNKMPFHIHNEDSREEPTPSRSVQSQMDELKRFVDSVKSELASTISNINDFAKKAKQEIMDILSNTSDPGTRNEEHENLDILFDELKNAKERVTTMIKNCERHESPYKEKITQNLKSAEDDQEENYWHEVDTGLGPEGSA